MKQLLTAFWFLKCKAEWASYDVCSKWEWMFNRPCVVCLYLMLSHWVCIYSRGGYVVAQASRHWVIQYKRIKITGMYLINTYWRQISVNIWINMVRLSQPVRHRSFYERLLLTCQFFIPNKLLTRYILCNFFKNHPWCEKHVKNSSLSAH
jgi:hypothetical protein